MRAILYSRVSTDDQATSGLGLAAQHASMTATVTARGWSIVAQLADEGVSGKVAPETRPALGEALAMLDSGEADVLVVAKLDRLSRSMMALLPLLDRAERARWSLTILDADVDTSTASGRLVASVLGSVAEWERRVIGERTKAALARKKAGGARLGRPVTVPTEIRAKVAELRNAGLSIAAVAAALNEVGHRTSIGTEWSKARVQQIIASLALDAEAVA